MAGAESFVVGIVLGAGSAIALWELGRFLRARRGRSRNRPAGAPLVPLTPPGTSPQSTDPPPYFGVVSKYPGEPRPPAVPRITIDRARPAPRVPDRTFSPEYVELSQRVVLHLDRLGPSNPDEVASIERTQAGIVQALGCAQSSLSRVLAKLVTAGVVAQERRHVRGLDRRVLVHELTMKGESLASELRSRGLGLVPGRPRDPRASLRPEPELRR